MMDCAYPQNVHSDKPFPSYAALSGTFVIAQRKVIHEASTHPGQGAHELWVLLLTITMVSLQRYCIHPDVTV